MTRNVKVVPKGLELFKYQVAGVRWMLRQGKKRYLIAEEMGCSYGGAVLKIKRSGHIIKITIEDLYNKQWDLEQYPTRIKSLCDGKLRYNRIKKVLAQGSKTTLTVTLCNSKWIRVTPDHEIQTKRGMVRADKLLLSDRVATNGKLAQVPKWSRIKSIEPYGKEAVFDLVMEDPYRNFVANGIVVANCGKTVEAIVVDSAWRVRNKDHRTLIIAPAILKLNWKREFEKWDVHGRSVEILSNGRSTSDADVVIMSISLLGGRHKKELVNGKERSVGPNSNKKLMTWIKDAGFTNLIVDEAHAIKSWRSKRTKAVFKLLLHIDNALLLTGTPMTRSAIDLHPLCCACEPGMWGKLRDFGHQYSNAVHNGFALEFRGTRNEEQLAEYMSRFMLRRFKKDVMPDLPDKLYTTIPVEMSDPEVAAKSLEFVDYALDEISNVSHTFNNAGERKDSVDPAHIMVIKRLCGLAKIDAIGEVLERFQDEQVVVFAQHRDVIDLIVSRIADSGRSVCTITGSTSDKDKNRHIDEFQSGEYQFIVCNITAGGVGITLTAASCVVMAELPWSPHEFAQAVDRLHRYGQENCVNIYTLVGIDSLEERIIDLLEEKSRNIERLVG